MLSCDSQGQERSQGGILGHLVTGTLPVAGYGFLRNCESCPVLRTAKGRCSGDLEKPLLGLSGDTSAHSLIQTWPSSDGVQGRSRNMMAEGSSEGLC